MLQICQGDLVCGSLVGHSPHIMLHDSALTHISHSMNRSFFQATVEIVLLYGCEAWTLTPTLEKSLNGCYIRMLRAALNIKWCQHVPNSELYDNLPRVGDQVAAKRWVLWDTAVDTLSYQLAR